MELKELEQIVGPINRGQLGEGEMFTGDGISKFAEDKYLNSRNRKPKPPPLIEDLSWMNPKNSKLSQKLARKSSKKR